MYNYMYMYTLPNSCVPRPSKPLVSVHHMEAHALTPRLLDDVSFPYLVLLVSGGHCILAVVRGTGEFVRLGSTGDDAPGEAFDKVHVLW